MVVMTPGRRKESIMKTIRSLFQSSIFYPGRRIIFCRMLHPHGDDERRQIRAVETVTITRTPIQRILRTTRPVSTILPTTIIVSRITDHRLIIIVPRLHLGIEICYDPWYDDCWYPGPYWYGVLPVLGLGVRLLAVLRGRISRILSWRARRRLLCRENENNRKHAR